MPQKSPDDLLALLAERGIAVATTEHAAVFTVEESRHLRGTIPGAHTKNLFLRDAKRRFFLVTLEEDRAVDLKALRPLIGARGGLSFGSPEALMEHLGVAPGSVSPLAVINDGAGAVTAVLDRSLLTAEIVNVHPLVNTRTTSIRPDDLVRVLADMGHAPEIIDLAAGSSAEDGA